MREFVLFVKFFAMYFWLCRAVIFTLAAFISLNAILFAYFEDQSLFTSIYFILITALTIGYGDVIPTTDLGKLVSIATGCIGVIMMGLIIAISNLALLNTVRAIHGKKINPKVRS